MTNPDRYMSLAQYVRYTAEHNTVITSARSFTRSSMQTQARKYSRKILLNVENAHSGSVKRYGPMVSMYGPNQYEIARNSHSVNMKRLRLFARWDRSSCPRNTAITKPMMVGTSTQSAGRRSSKFQYQTAWGTRMAMP